MDITTHTSEAVELLKTLIAIPSVSRDEGAAADALCAYLTHSDIAHERVGNNIICRDPNYRADRPTLLLNAHIDTVKPAAGWRHDPFTPTLEGDRLYGLGSNDCGGGLVSLLQVFRLLASRARNYNMVYAVSAEEEVSGAGGLTMMLPRLPKIDVAIVGEPTAMQPAVAEKGLMVVDVTVSGVAGHAARNEGVNAVYKALDQVQWLRNHQFAEVSPLLGPTKMSVTIINGGTQHNCVPDRCTYTIDIRTNDLHTNLQVLDFLTANLDAEVKARSTRLNSSHIAANHPLVVRCKELGLTPFGSPTLSDQALMPWPSLKLGPGDSARSHTANEFITLGEIRQAIELYVSLLDGLTL